MSDFASAQYQFEGNQTVTMAQHGSDKGLFVEFRHEAVKQDFRSREEGRPVFEDVVFIKIMFPGDKTKTVDRPAKLKDDDSGPSDIRRFPAQWQQFQAEESQVGAGMPLAEFPALTKSQVAEFKAMNIHTVEQLSDMSDSQLTWLGARELREQARNWLDKAKGNAVEARLQTALDQRDQVIDQQQQQLDAMKAQIADLQSQLKGTSRGKTT